MNEAYEELRREELAQELCGPPWIVGAGAMLARASDRPEWLVTERIPAGDLTLFAGAPGVKKSWLAYALAIAVAQGSEWVGLPTHRPVKRRSGEGCEVLVLNYDNSTAECARRFLRLGLRASDPVCFHSLDVGQPFRMPEASDKLAMIVDAMRPSLVLIDTFRQAHTSDENSSKEMMGIMGSLKRLYASGAAVVVVHHTTKGAAMTPRGSGEIDGSFTAEVIVAADRGLLTAQWVKHRSWPLDEARETLYFRVSDHADRTRVEKADPPVRKERKS